MKSGIYIIRNNVNDTVYIGQSKNLDNRFKSHINHLNSNSHGNPILQQIYNENKSNRNFMLTFKILELCNMEDLITKEKYWLEKFPNNFNIYPPDFKDWNENHSKLFAGTNSYHFKALTESKVNCNEHDGNVNKRNGGTKNPRSILTLYDCFKIKELLLQNISCNIISKKFKVSPSTIKGIRRGSHWSNKQLGGNLSDWIKEVDVKNGN